MPQKRTSSSKHHDLDSGLANRRGGRKKTNYDHSQPPADTSVTRARKSVSSLDESKRADELRNQLAAILELSQDAILSKTLSGTINNWNKTAERIYGYRSDEILGKSVSTIFPPENLSELDQITERLKRGERIENYETVRIRKDGTRVEVALSFSPLTDRNGTPVGATVIARDITGRKRAEAEIVYHANLIEVLSDAIFASDEHYRLTAWNRAAEELYGWKAKEVLGRNESEIVQTEWPTAKTEAIKRAIAETGHWRGEAIQQRKDGTRFPSEVSTITLHNGKGQVTGYISVNRDITERKRTEDALIVSESRYRRLFETAKDGILILDAETGMIVDVNPFLIHLLGYSKESFLGTTLWELGTFKDIASNKYNFLKLHEKEYIRYDNLPLETAGGLRKNVEFVSNVYQENQQKVIQCNIRDITERKQAEDRVQQSEARYRVLVEQASDGIFITNAQGQYLDVNTSGCAMLGYTREEILAMDYTHILLPEDLAQDPPKLDELIAGKTLVRERLYRRKDGTIFRVEISAKMLSDGRVQNIVRDITERLCAEDTMRLQSAALNAAANTIMITNRDGVIEWVNPAFSKLTGYSLEEANGKNPRELVKSGVHSSQFYKDLWSTLLSGHVWKGEVINRRKDGSLYTEEQTITPLKNDDGTIKHFIAIKQDITERKRAEEQIQNQLDRLAALREIDIAIGGSLDIRVTLKILLQQVIKQLHADAADILLLNPSSLMLTFGAGLGFNTHAVELTQLRLGDPFAGRVALEQTLISIPDLGSAETPPQYRELLRAEKFVSYIGVPLFAKGHVKGVLEILHREPLHPDKAWFDFLHALAGQAAIALDSTGLFDNLQRSNADLVIAYENTIEGWSRALDLRDKETEGHTQRVTEFTLKLAREAGVNDAELSFIRRGALLHDIGKMGVPDAILLKQGPLTDEEWIVMRKHPGFAYDLLSPIKYLAPAMDIPYCHHEKWDGSGYPRGLKGQEIPLAARLFAVVDVWDALNSDRPYRPAWQKDKILDHIRSLSGTHFDPHVVNVFFKMQEPSQ